MMIKPDKSVLADSFLREKLSGLFLSGWQFERIVADGVSVWCDFVCGKSFGEDVGLLDKF